MVELFYDSQSLACFIIQNELGQRACMELLKKVYEEDTEFLHPAYYSVDKAYLHKEVLIRASATTVRIFSKEGVFLCEWPRATARSQWCTDPNHLPANYKEISEWNGTYFTQKAMTVGPNTGEMIRRILASRKLEVQTYRMCQGVLSFIQVVFRSMM